MVKCLGIGSLLIGFFSSIPYNSAGLVSDGGRIRALRQGGAQAERTCALFLLSGSSIGGQRPRYFDSKWLAQALALADNSPDYLNANLLTYYHALDKGEVENAAGYLEQILKVITQGRPAASLYRATYLLEAAYFEATYRHNPVGARNWLEQARKSKGSLAEFEGQCRLRAEAAVLLAEGNFQEAIPKIHTALAKLPFTFDLGFAKAEEDWLHQALVTAQAALK